MHYSQTEITVLIQLRHDGVSWPDVASQLERAPEAVHAKARRLRDAGKWKLPNGSDARGAPDVGSGRPAKVVEPIDVTFRVSSDVAGALEEIAREAEVPVGDVVREALARWKRRRKAPPFDLAVVEAKELAVSPVPVTLGVSLPATEVERCLAKLPAVSLSGVVRKAVHALLRTLGYLLLTPS